MIQQREELRYPGFAHIMLDGCRAHFEDELLDFLFKNGIELHVLPPHSSDQLQPLDLGIFSILKSAQKRIQPSEKFSKQSAEVTKIVGGRPSNNILFCKKY